MNSLNRPSGRTFSDELELGLKVCPPSRKQSHGSDSRPFVFNNNNNAKNNKSFNKFI